MGEGAGQEDPPTAGLYVAPRADAVVVVELLKCLACIEDGELEGGDLVAWELERGD